MKKIDEDYKYLSSFGCKTKKWKMSEIVWENFEAFVRVQEKINTAVSLIWYKYAGEEMKDLKYAVEGSDCDMFELRKAGKVISEIDVFLEHDLSEHIQGENETVGNESNGG